MDIQKLRLAAGSLIAAALLTLSACGGPAGSSSGTGGSGSGNTQSSTGSVTTIISDDATEDWATIGVKVLSISLVPQGGGSPVSIYTAPTPTPVINLVQLDQLGEIIGNAQVSAGTYVGAVITISANPGDVMLTVSADPETGFAGTAGASIPSSQIKIQGATGSAGSLTVPVNISFASPLTVTASQTNQLDLEFNLAHPAFIVQHVPPVGSPFWAVNFNGPVRHHPIYDITRLVLRHMYATVNSVSTDGTSIAVTRDFAVRPATTPETAIASTQTLNVLADASNGTLYYDVDAKTSTTIKSFSSLATTLPNKFVRIAARYQQNGTLTAVRVWASSSFNNIWISPEGHVLHVNTSTDVITVENEDGVGVPLTVNSNTQFFFRTPQNALSDATPIGTGTSFLAANNLVRGFKVHASVVDALASPLVAQAVDIEIAKFDGSISAATSTGFTYTRQFATASDDYTVNLGYISSATPNGKDSNGNAITGYQWWNFAFPTLAVTGSNAVSSFVSATNGSASFGGTAAVMPVWGVSYATWNDSANPNAWSVRGTVLLPTPVPLGTVATNWITTSNGGTFAMSVSGGTNSVNVNLTSTSGSATLAYQVDNTNGIITVSPQDLTSASGLANASKALASGTKVKVFGIPQADGSIKAYVVFYYTGTTPVS